MDSRLTDKVLIPSSTSYGNFRRIKINNLVDILNHNRYKLGGGGYITGLAMQLVLEPEITEIHQDIMRAVDRFTKEGIYCGLHTADPHGDPTCTGCGANDKLREILERGLVLKDPINDTISSIYKVANIKYDSVIVNKADEGLKITLGHETYFNNSNGLSRFEVIMQKISEVHSEQKIDDMRPLSVCKNLAGKHQELFIYVNLAEGFTFSQAEFTRKIKQKHPSLIDDQIPGAFVIDVPRISQLAKAMAKGRDDDEEAYQIAFHAGLSFQLAIAAELTDGTLENYLSEAA